MQEGMENWIGLLKQLTTAHIKPNGDWLVRLAHYMDLYVLGGLRENVVDFKFAKQKYKNEFKLIWEDGVTDQMFLDLEKLFPQGFKNILKLIDQIEFGNLNIPEQLKDVRYQQYMSDKATENIQSLKNGIDEFVRLTMIEKDSEFIEDNKVLTDKLKKQMKRTRASKLQNLKNIRDIAYSRAEERFPTYDISSPEILSP